MYKELFLNIQEKVIPFSEMEEDLIHNVVFDLILERSSSKNKGCTRVEMLGIMFQAKRKI